MTPEKLEKIEPTKFKVNIATILTFIELAIDRVGVPIKVSFESKDKEVHKAILLYKEGPGFSLIMDDKELMIPYRNIGGIYGAIKALL